MERPWDKVKIGSKLQKKPDLDVCLTGMTELQMFREKNKLGVLENSMFEFQLNSNREGFKGVWGCISNFEINQKA